MPTIWRNIEDCFSLIKFFKIYMTIELKSYYMAVFSKYVVLHRQTVTLMEEKR